MTSTWDSQSKKADRDARQYHTDPLNQPLSLHRSRRKSFGEHDKGRSDQSPYPWSGDLNDYYCHLDEVGYRQLFVRIHGQ